MNFKRFQIAVVVSFLALASPCVATLTRLPTNTQALTGSTVRLECFMENKNYPPSWSHIKVGSTQSNDVYLTIKIEGQEGIAGRMTEQYFGRFKVHEDRPTGEYSLEVTDVQPGDAGKYTCTARGGLGQQAFAELGVIESDPRCASNTTEAIGENICNHEPDYIELSCNFRYNGNILPKVNWVKPDQLSQVVRIDDAQFTVVSGEAVSKFVVRADTENLNGSSFMCVVSSPNVAEETRLSCITPVINVLKITNLTESRKVEKPEEVHCNPLPHLHENGCKWVKRKLEGDELETVVIEGRLLNLYRPEFDSGIYVCIVECNIRGQPCPVEALTITYEPTEPRLGKITEAHSSSSLVIILTVVLSVVFTLSFSILGVMLYRKFTSGPSDPSAEDPANQINSSNQSSGSSHERRPVSASESVPLTVTEREEDVAVDMPDHMRLLPEPGERDLRNRRAEERAMARMRNNEVFVAMRQVFDPPADNGDVAEGICRTPEADKDE